MAISPCGYLLRNTGEREKGKRRKGKITTVFVSFIAGGTPPVGRLQETEMFLEIHKECDRIPQTLLSLSRENNLKYLHDQTVTKNLYFKHDLRK